MTAITGFEDFAVGQVFSSRSQLMDAAGIKAFAAQFDTQAQHMDEEAAKHTLFGELVASGWHTASVTMRLLLDSAMAGVSGRGMGVKVHGIDWSAPVRAGDTLHVVSEVMEVRASRSKPDRGLVVLRTETRNQDEVKVQEITTTVLLLRSGVVI